MGKLIVFNSITLDGYFTGEGGDLSWAYSGEKDPEWDEFVKSNASGDGMLLFGRVTYDMMKSYWPTPMALQNDPVVAAGMNAMPKVVFSRTMESATWNNTTVIKDNIVDAVRKLKADSERGMVILGSGTIVSQLASEGLIDEYQMVILPLAIGKGRTMFEGMKGKLALRLKSSRVFGNGKVVLCYEPTS